MINSENKAVFGVGCCKGPIHWFCAGAQHLVLYVCVDGEGRWFVM